MLEIIFDTIIRGLVVIAERTPRKCVDSVLSRPGNGEEGDNIFRSNMETLGANKEWRLKMRF